MPSLLSVRVENIDRSKLFVASALLNSTGGGLMMAFLLIYFDRTTDVGLAVIGLAITVGRALAAVTPALFGRLLDRFGPRRIAIFGDLTTGAGFLLCLLAENAVFIVASQFLAQAGSHMFWTSSRGLVGLASGGQGMQTWFGLIGSLRNIGLGIGTLLSALAFSADSIPLLHVVVLCCALLYIGSTVALWAWRIDDERGPPEATAEEPEEPVGEGYRHVWADRPYRRLLVLNMGLVLAAMVIPLVIAVYATEQLGLPAFVAGALVLANTVVVAVLSTHVAAWTEKRPAIRNLTGGYALNVLAFVIFWIAAAAAGRPWAAAALLGLAMLIYTVAEMISTPAANVLSVSLAPSERNGRHMAAFQMTWAIGMTLTPAVFGWLLTTGPHATWVALIVLTLLCLLGGAAVGQRKEA
ncbi:MFS transporter [Nocardiopsis alba]|uniref:MFS transporter n=1 Tax=Nocardiopsis alba TaxID=53437 RepID=UPI0033B72AFA